MANRKLIVEVIADSSSYERGLARAGQQTKAFSNEFSKAERGVLAGSGVFRGAGRSIAFATGGFIAFAGAADLVRSSLEKAEQSEKAQRALEAALQRTGQTVKAQLPDLKEWALRQTRFGVSAADAEQGLARLEVLTGSTRKALAGYNAALEISRATGKSFQAVSLATAKALNGQTTALARYIGRVKRGTTDTELLQLINEKFAGQAAANTTQADRFNATLANTEEIIGRGILPILNKYLDRASKYLDKLDRTGELQRKVNHASKDATGAISALSDIIHTADSVTGSFKHTLELIIGFKIARKALEFARGFKLIGGAAATEAGEVGLLRTALLGLSAPEVLAGLAAVYGAVKLVQNATKHTTTAPPSFGPIVKPGESITRVQQDITFLKSIGQTDTLLGKTLQNLNREMEKSGSVVATAQQVADAQKQAADQLAANAELGAHGAFRTGRGTGGIPNTFDTGPATSGRGVNLTAGQRNAFFDADVQRLLNRAAFTSLPNQLKVLDRVIALVQARLAKTKDVTRRLNLEDEVLSLQNQRKGISQQIHQGFLDTLDTATGRAQYAVEVAQSTATFADDVRALSQLEAAIERQIKAEGRTSDLLSQLFQTRQELAAARASQVSGRQFVALGLTSTGDKRTPGLRALRRELGFVGGEVKGTFLDTGKTKSLLASVRKILSGGMGAVGEDVRKKIAEILGNLNDQLDQNTTKNLRKWKGLTSKAFLAGIPNLTPEQKRELARRFDVVGAGGVAPATGSQAFALAGTIQVDSTVNVDGNQLAKTTTKHQIKRSKKRTLPRGA